MTALERAGVAIANPGKSRSEDWRTQALCAQIGPGSLDFDPVPGKRGALTYPDPEPLQRVCLKCPVLAQCEKFAIAVESGLRGATHTILAGLTPTQRDQAYRRARVGGASVLPGMFRTFRAQIGRPRSSTQGTSAMTGAERLDEIVQEIYGKA